MDFLLNNNESCQITWANIHSKRIVLNGLLLIIYFIMLFCFTKTNDQELALWSSIASLMICGVTVPLLTSIYAYKNKVRPLKMYLYAPAAGLLCSILFATPYIIYECLNQSGKLFSS